MRLRLRAFLVVSLFLAASGNPVSAAEKADPKVNSLFPLGGQPGTSFEVRIRGENLGSVYGVWFDCDAIEAEVRKIEKTVEEVDVVQQAGTTAKDTKEFHHVVLKLDVDHKAAVGAHTFRLVSRQGLSSPLALLVNPEPQIQESGQSINSPQSAQPITFPVVVNGRLGHPGELDYYAFEVGEGQHLRFEVITSTFAAATVAGDPQLILYEPTGSWFDPQRIQRLEVRDETGPGPGNHQWVTSHFLPRLIRRFDRKGRYLAEVGTLEGQGGPDFSYQLRVIPTPARDSGANHRRFPGDPAHGSSPLVWQERDFSRRIDRDHLTRLWSRAIRIPEPGQEGKTAAGSKDVARPEKSNRSPLAETIDPSNRLRLPSPTREEEPNDWASRAAELSIPVTVEGAIQHPGDVDIFRFKAGSGQALAFEIETPDTVPPFFNPHLIVVDDTGTELVSNIYREVAGVGDDWIKSIKAKTVYTFEQAGEYFLQIRDLTTRRAAPHFRYRVLVRPQVPHIGEVAVKMGRGEVVDHINLRSGESRKLTVVTEPEEGFDGEIALTLENLPTGVQALAAATTTANPRLLETGNGRGAMHKERFFPPRHLATMVLVAGRDSPATPMPQRIRLTARPIVDGKVGKALAVQEILLMICRPETEQVTMADTN
ncbi:MAG: hypothetical protein OXU26_09750 [Acidobacteriota bacterium]|nr:hypothetical protein [Acidobacteriota bacterium]